MQVVTTIEEVRAARRQWAEVGFVPTMGFLHAGHLSLVQQSKAENGVAIASIFVNPTQFGPNEDFASYPRDTPRDLALLEAAGCDLVWMPSVEEIYPAGFSSYVEVEGVTAPLEGARRPGHFRGVATVVTKLFNVVQPTKAYFGQKDAQQTVVIRQFVRDLAMPVEVVIAPTIREADGLAMSSRNSYLNAEQRAAAPVLYRALTAAQTAYAAGQTDAEAIRQLMLETLAQEPLAQVDYVSIADPRSLQELTTIDQQGVLVSLAVRIGKTRLIDNLVM
ncbi:MAG TPA: pantoate--beta-alanine ligase [Herpetosiphon sp.]|uniref:Pantothenate synthetase n=1 Tax=Herpetosiphon aurantiacus (strain ATCC 23779 / DSM 785 / 114-95) TaxID=316274 RepID=PANC_HERA2|nr:pantoate--beta-alanine ligase [Herpetosiphon sp.]A9B3W0.1 RecName: Full=Pantothenate synthetase; Short=PS; AltName: Full=Pantoate--beta-alanine ligase; AltName: Full=Pantoate-activating enzyme [Herpetosiphon aurantiacus DSM 785]ABX06096.1 pantoate--beta-alanine ligase [Herpetosiphon aurantiacus DSM 785]HBW50128.1 pantoate--beta-alanine ligase [Herpetosiphon sp.]